jgi:curved DNA-binding protein CbpA
LKDYYKILDLEFGADILAVKKAYRRLALKYHPDRNKAPDAAQKFTEITEAYEVLKDPVKKSEYDRFYQAYFTINNQGQFHQKSYEWDYQRKQQEWSGFGREKAKEYSSIPFEEFAKRLLKEISVGANYIPNAIAILLVGFSIVVLLTILPKLSEDGNGAGLFILMVIVALGYLEYRLFIVAQADYKEERKRKLVNKK